ncbi:hypothetical protein KDH_25650 [Dictyobacter sp. S3.2.2.5]|uniref:N-acetyltransferase domain-containing protein n=2 Tax=Dictyobacter halimunensis TaxID=3026934 RepID=A0ABQ6FTD3_9CHLR|nr:hypothetical protein KDH_25650 [Dictyobacter sp. S3.2.2.5]
MEQPYDGLAEQAMVEMIEANTNEFLLTLGRRGGGEECNEAGRQWIIGGSPLAYHNCVIRAHLSEENVDEVIEDSIRLLQSYNVPGSWHVGPWMGPDNLGSRLIAHGFTHEGSEPGMALDLGQLNESISVPDDLVIQRVRNERELEIWARTLGMGFGEGEIEANWVGAMYRKIGFDEDGLWHHYLARWHGEPVATASLFLGAGVAGIYFVFTLPQARRQGIGAAITLAALQDASMWGCSVGVLGSSSMGYSVYQRLGFQEYCRIEMYEWTPSDSR